VGVSREAAAPIPAAGVHVVGAEVQGPTRYAFAGGEAVLFTRRCPGVERANEDACALLPWGDDAGALVVADGVGGHPAGGDAAALAIDSLRRALTAGRLAEESLRDSVLSGIETANRRVLADGRGAMTTIAVALIRAGRTRAIHVGDSGVLVTGQRGRLKLVTTFHSPVGYAVESGMLDEEEAVHHEDRHVVSNVVGAADMRMEIGSPLTLAPRDTLLVASDGIYDNFFPDEIVQRVRKGSLAEVAAGLDAEATRRMVRGREGQPSKPDDVTFLLFRLR
jgi:serine/threonine protein phosphatase PrpC